MIDAETKIYSAIKLGDRITRCQSQDRGRALSSIPSSDYREDDLYQVRLRVVPHFSSGIVSPFLAWGDFHARSRFARFTIPDEKWGTTRSLISGHQCATQNSSNKTAT